MSGFPYAARAGDRVLLAATVTAVRERDRNNQSQAPEIKFLGKRLVLEVYIHDCCRAHIAPEKIHSVVSQEIRTGDRVTWHGDMHGPKASGQRFFGTVLYIEPAASVMANKDSEPGKARALVKPDGVTARPQIDVAYLSRVDPEIT